MRRGALFHDIGKLATPDTILRKAGALTLGERTLVERHPAIGEDLLLPMATMKGILPIVRHHHERLDGSGYPDGLSGDAIAMPVRIVAVADAFDAMTSSREYREALPPSEVLERLTRGVGRNWFDGDVVEALSARVQENTGLAA